MQPLGVISWRRAITLFFINQENPSKGLEVIEYYNDDYIKTSYRSYQVPSVVRSPIYIKQRKNTITFSRKNVFIRDGLICQYCHKPFPPNELEYDHVIPRSKWDEKWGTPTTYTNIVTCCQRCNRQKDNKTLKECGMKLLREPKIPGPHQYILGVTPWSTIPEQWLKYLPPLYKTISERFNTNN
jgi:5-methylcytosine-specific restriction endonuclease McrA